MASAFLVGCGVAAVSYALKGAIHVGKQLQARKLFRLVGMQK